MSENITPKPVKLKVVLEIETDGETPAEELGWMLNLIRFELTHWPRWRGKVRRVEMVSPVLPACQETSDEH